MLAVILLSFLVSSARSGGSTSKSSIPSTTKVARTALVHADEGAWIAPDGARGFGSGRTRREIEKLMRSTSSDDRAFLARLRDIASGVEIELARADALYDESGYYALLDGDEGTPEKLAVRFRELATDVPRILFEGGPRADLMARLLTDERFRARSRVVEGVASELADLRGALALFAAQTDGWVDLSDDEVGVLAQRADQACARLRAIQFDVQALQESAGSRGANAPWQADYERLLLMARSHERTEGELGTLLARLDQSEEAMSTPLFTTRLEARLAAEYDARDDQIRRAHALAPLIRELDPDSATPTPTVPTTTSTSSTPQPLSKSERRQRAAHLAMQASTLDPLDDELVWLAASLSDRASGRMEARRWYDRFLALHGIRSSAHRTYQDRVLTREEGEALEAVQEAQLTQQ